MNKRFLLKAGLVGALCLTVTGGVIACTPQQGGETPPPLTYEMSVTILDVELEIGQRETVSVDVTNMENEDVICVVEDSSIAGYDQLHGWIEGYKAGSTTITFMLKNKPSVRKSITITVINTQEYDVKIGDADAVKVVYGNKVEKPSDLQTWKDERTVYTFDCWVEKESGIEWDFDSPITQNLVLVAKWNEAPRMYDVDVNGTVLQYTYGDFINKPADLEDYATDTQVFTFDGWVVKGTKTKWNFETDTVKQDGLILEPSFIESVRYYTVTYTVDGTVYKTDKYEYNATVVHPENPAKPSTDEYDYVFVEWIGEDNGMKAVADMQFEASFKSVKNSIIVSGYVVDKAGKPLVAQIYLDGTYMGKTNSKGLYSVKVKPDGKEHSIIAIRDGYYEMGAKFIASSNDVEVDNIVTMKSSVEGSDVQLSYDRFGLVDDVDKNFELSINASGNATVGYTFLKGLSDGTLAFTLKFNDGCGMIDGEWANATINLNGIITDNNNKKIGMGVLSDGTLNTSGTNLALTAPTKGNGSVGDILGSIREGNTDVSYSFVYTKTGGEVSLFAKSTLMPSYVYIGSYSSNALDGELALGFAITCDKSTAVLAFEVTSLTYGSEEDAISLIQSARKMDYKVVTHVQNVDGTYTSTEEVKSGFGNVSLEPDSKDNFVINTEKSVLSGTVTEGLVLEVYYDRVVHTVTYMVDGDVYLEQKVRHGATSEVPPIVPKKGYTGRWDKTLGEITGNEVVTAIYVLSDIYSLSVKLKGKTIEFNGVEYSAYDVSEDEYAKAVITVEDSEGKNVEFDGEKSVVKADVYTVNVTYEGSTYTKKVEVSDCDVNLTVEITKTKLGGSVGGFDSFIHENKTYPSVDAVSINHHDYTYNADVQGERYYLESDIFFDAIDGRTNTAMVGIMAAVRNELLLSNGAGKLIIGVTQAGKLAYTYKGGWSQVPIEIADVKDKITYNGNKYSYKLGVYRNNADFAIFVNGEYIDTITLGMFGKCGFGVGSVGANDNNGKTHFTNYVYSFNPDLLDAMQEHVAKDEVEVEINTDSDYVLDKNGNKLYYQGEQINNDMAQRISLEIVDYYGNTKRVVSADRSFKLSLAPGTYTVKARYEGVAGTTTKSSVVTISNNKNQSFTYFIPLTDIGGSFTIPGGNQVNSFNRNYTVNEADSITVKTSTCAYINNVVSDTAYIEGTFSTTTIGWYGFVLNVSEGSTGENYNRIVFAVLLDSVGANHSLYVKHSEIGEWWQGSGKGSIQGLIPNGSTTYKMGVLRVRDYYYVYINNTLFWQSQITALDITGKALPADNKSGFGVFCGSNHGNLDRLVDDIKYTTDAIVANTILGKNTYKFVCDDGAMLVSGGREIANGGDVYGIENPNKLLKITIPAGKSVVDIDVRIDGEKQNVKYESDGVYSFVATTEGDVIVDVSFEEVETASLTLGYKSAVAIKDGKEYALYDIADVVATNISVSMLNVYTGQVNSFVMDGVTKTLEIPTGVYVITYKYNNNVSSQTVHIKAGDNVFDGQISKSYLGGSITFTNKTTGVQHTLTSFDRVNAGSTSGGSWSLIDGQRNSVHMTNYSYVMQDKVIADQVYVEGKFDLTNQTFTGKIDESFGGLLIAHGLDELSGNESGWVRSNSHKLMAGIYKESLVVNWDKEFGTSNTVVIANLEQYGLLNGDRSRVKLGVLRNKSTYYFYVNDTYVGKYIWEVQTDASGIGLVDIKSNVKIYEFNYSTRKEVIDALTPEQKLKDIDIYFIAGQSNASGYTKYEQDEIKTINDDYVYGFNNIWYTGNSRSGSETTANNRVRDISLMRAGYGAYTTTMGVEPGLAEALSVYYNHETGREAGFIKYAAGGTRLLNYFTGENKPEGNWVPPSYQAMLTSGVTEKTGGLYRNFLAQARKSIADYKKLGYNPVVKGLYWMQGESDRDAPSEYLKAFKCFASDVRADLTEICEQDCSTMPIIIGEISRSFASCDTNSMNLNAGFIAMQNTIPNNVANTYIVKSSVFDQNAYINGVATKVGSDQHHWNYKDHLKIGNMVGECILKNILGQE